MSMFSPRFKSVAEKAGWDEEALLLATLVVQDTPDRNAQNRKRSDLLFKSPPTSSRRKRRARRRSPGSMSIAVFNLDDDDESTSKNGKGNEKKVDCIDLISPKQLETDEGKAEKGTTSTANSTSSTFPCADRLREELSCAICLEICFEPSTTPCGHSFCKDCLKNAAEKCGKRCPKCRQLISNGRSCTINTVLWNTIQLLFPVEVEMRKETKAANQEAKRQNPGTTYKSDTNLRTSRRLRPVGSRREGMIVSRREERGRGVASQDEDAALALRLQREEFMTIYRGSSLARDNLREMAQRAINLRVRHRAV